MQNEPAGNEPLDPRTLRDCFGAFVTGVTVITTVDSNGEWHGLTANSFSSVSLDPPLILWSQRLNAKSYPVFRDAERFTVNILATDQVDISKRFASSANTDRFAGVGVSTGEGNVPMLDGCAAYVECVKENAFPGGDHAVFLGRVSKARTTGKLPLAFGNGKYMAINPHDVGTLTRDLGLPVAVDPNLVGDAIRAAEALAKELDLTTGVCVWGNCGPTMVRWVEPENRLAVTLRTGLVLPLLSSAAGRVFSAHLPPELTAPLVEAELSTSFRGRQYPSPVSTAEIEETNEEVRQQGFALMRDQRVNASVRIDSLSIPVVAPDGRMLLALSVMANPETTPDLATVALASLTSAAQKIGAVSVY